MLIRANGLVAQSNAKPQTNAEPDVINTGTDEPGRRRTELHARTIKAVPPANRARRTSAPARVPSVIAPPAPATTTPTSVAFTRPWRHMLSSRPALTSVIPAATGMSLKSTCDMPNHRGVASVNDHTNEPARSERNAIVMAIPRAVTDATERKRVAAP